MSEDQAWKDFLAKINHSEEAVLKWKSNMLEQVLNANRIEGLAKGDIEAKWETLQALQGTTVLCLLFNLLSRCTHELFAHICHCCGVFCLSVLCPSSALSTFLMCLL